MTRGPGLCNVMITAHKKGACVVAVFTRDVAETKATRATEAGARQGLPADVHDRARGIGQASPRYDGCRAG